MYVDSAGCSSCRLDLSLWQQLVEEADSLFHGRVGFLLYFQPKSEREMASLFAGNRFTYPVFMDLNGSINRLNRFRPEMQYQCFLLDKDNKVVMMGNPALNIRIWELYKKQIKNPKSPEKSPLTPKGGTGRVNSLLFSYSITHNCLHIPVNKFRLKTAALHKPNNLSHFFKLTFPTRFFCFLFHGFQQNFDVFFFVEQL